MVLAVSRMLRPLSFMDVWDAMCRTINVRRFRAVVQMATMRLIQP